MSKEYDNIPGRYHDDDPYNDQSNASDMLPLILRPLLWEMVVEALSEETGPENGWQKSLELVVLPSRYLPFLGFDATFLRAVGAMEDSERERYLATFTSDVLSPDDLLAWQALSEEHRMIGMRMRDFWRRRRGLA